MKNWKQIIQQLLDSGMTEQSIADRVGKTTQPTIHRIKTGEIPDPRHSLGEKIVNLHASTELRSSEPVL